ncbi:AraC family transcriptional regulator [Streptomyces brasiliensis]|uniref:AraC family transcriptional regulator n=1 Tax=Streptomyces brasiliensis TaxID=1954 RepID=UPI001E60993E|nr:AraC family transcriptional regulator [Streptomyces brasiliensis]
MDAIVGRHCGAAPALPSASVLAGPSPMGPPVTLTSLAGQVDVGEDLVGGGERSAARVERLLISEVLVMAPVCVRLVELRMLDKTNFLRESSTMAIDHLSEVLDLIEVRGQISSAFAVRGQWVTQSVIASPLKLSVMVRGRCRLSTDGLDVPIEMEAGDVAVLTGRSWLRAEGGAGDGPLVEFAPEAGDYALRIGGADFAVDDVVLGGHVELNPAGAALLTQALPPVTRIRASDTAAPALRTCVDRLVQEVTGERMGASFAVRQHAQLLILEVLRAYLDQAELSPGWLRALTDDRLRPALTLMHGEPGRSWGLEELARAAAMSRTSFAVRFRSVAGVPPLTYLNSWRMLLARRALRDDDIRIGALAAQLGYTSESAFSTAFKREVGEAPLRYRYRLRQAS